MISSKIGTDGHNVKTSNQPQVGLSQAVLSLYYALWKEKLVFSAVNSDNQNYLFKITLSSAQVVVLWNYFYPLTLLWLFFQQIFNFLHWHISCSINTSNSICLLLELFLPEKSCLFYLAEVSISSMFLLLKSYRYLSLCWCLLFNLFSACQINPNLDSTTCDIICTMFHFLFSIKMTINVCNTKKF